MMGTQKSEPQLFHYAVNLEKRVRANHPLRQIKAAIDFSFVREEEGKEGVKSKHLTLAIGSAMRKQWRGLCA